jgi:hypothetical protein
MLLALKRNKFIKGIAHEINQQKMPNQLGCCSRDWRISTWRGFGSI